MSEDIAILLVPNAPPFEIRKIRHYADRPYAKIHADNLFKHFEVPTLADKRLKRAAVNNESPLPNTASTEESVAARAGRTEERERQDAPTTLAVSKSRTRKKARLDPAVGETPEDERAEVSLFATITAAKETAQEDMANLLELASKLKFDPVLVEALRAAANEFEQAAK